MRFDPVCKTGKCLEKFINNDISDFGLGARRLALSLRSNPGSAVERGRHLRGRGNLRGNCARGGLAVGKIAPSLAMP